MTTIAPSRIGCDAVIGKTVGDFGYTLIYCTQVVGIRQYEAAAPFLAHLTVGYCSRDGHRASVERRYPPLDTVPMTRQIRVVDCISCADKYGPPHDASPRCESGKRSHCSCDTCF